jgi:hypothetical protein
MALAEQLYSSEKGSSRGKTLMVDWIHVGMNALLAFSSTGAALVVAGAFNGEGWNVALLSCLFTGLVAFAKEY